VHHIARIFAVLVVVLDLHHGLDDADCRRPGDENGRWIVPRDRCVVGELTERVWRFGLAWVRNFRTVRCCPRVRGCRYGLSFQGLCDGVNLCDVLHRSSRDIGLGDLVTTDKGGRVSLSSIQRRYRAALNGEFRVGDLNVVQRNIANIGDRKAVVNKVTDPDSIVVEVLD